MSPILVLVTITVVGLFVVMLATVVRSYRSPRQGSGATTDLVVKLAWSVIPWLLLVGAVTPAVIGIIHDSGDSPVQPGVFQAAGN